MTPVMAMKIIGFVSGFVTAGQMDQDHLEMEQPVHQSSQSLTGVRACGAAQVQAGWRWWASDVEQGLGCSCVGVVYSTVQVSSGCARESESTSSWRCPSGERIKWWSAWTSSASTRCWGLLQDFHGMLSASARCQGLPRDVKGFHRMLSASTDVEGSRRTSTGC